jgi:glycosyltransferase involved in cell wall biosynthesis
LQAVRNLCNGYRGLSHLIWADRDWGVLHLAASWFGTPVCATFHSCADELPSLLNHPSQLRRLHGIILMSGDQRPYFLAQGVDPERLHVVHHGVDCGFFRPPASRHVDGPFKVLFVGNYRRNFERLKDICLRLAATPDIRIKIVAPQSRSGLFAGMANVDFVSGLSDVELRDAYRDASCLLLTLDGASANNALLEAMASGLPIVAEDVGGIREYTGGDCGTLCPAGPAEALVASILDLRAQPAVATIMGVRARLRAVDLDWPLVAKRTMSVYEQVRAVARDVVANK